MAEQPLTVLMTLHDFARTRSTGAVVTFDALCSGLRARGHRVTPLSFDELPERLSARARFLLFPALVAKHARAGFDVVDAATADAWMWSLRRPAGTPLLVTRSHGLEHPVRDALLESSRAGDVRLSWKYGLYHGGLRVREVNATLRRADLTIFPNQQERDYAVSALGVDERRAHVVPHGLPDELLGLPFEPTPPPEQPIRIGLVACFNERKGIRHAAPALSAALRARPGMRVTATTLAPHVALEWFDDDVRDRIDAVGPYRPRDLAHLLRGHHVTILASLAEGFSKGLTEAMACGLAPIATPVGGAPDILRDGVNGLLVPVRDRAAIEHALLRLDGDRELLDRLRRAAYATAQAFGWGPLVERRIELYREFLERRNGR